VSTFTRRSFVTISAALWMSVGEEVPSAIADEMQIDDFDLSKVYV
jgi:hypothetical protein